MDHQRRLARTLRRLQLSAGDNPQLRLDAYLALTSNTAQVGAHIELSFHGGGFVISANAGFDALFVFTPFQFTAEITVSAAITWHGHNLASVKLDFLLTGPHPWHAVGSASFDVLWWSISVGFDVTWGDSAPAPLPPPPDIAALLRSALAPTTHVHPAATMTVRQHLVPLDTTVDQFGSYPLQAPLQFTIDRVTVESTSPAKVTVEDTFAPGQFTQLSPADQLAAPSFESFHSGIAFAQDVTTAGSVARASGEIETVVIDPLAPVPRPPRVLFPAGFATALETLRAAPSSPPPPAIRLREIAYVVSSTVDLARTGEPTTFAAARRLRATGTQVTPAALIGA